MAGVWVDLSLTQKACLERVFREAVDRYYESVIYGTPSPETPVRLLGQPAIVPPTDQVGWLSHSNQTVTTDLGMLEIGTPGSLPVRALCLDGDL